MFFAVSTVEAPKEALNGAAMPAEDRAQLQKDLAQAAEQLKHASGDEKKLAVVRSAVEKAQQAVENPEAAADDADVFATPIGLDWRAFSRKLANKKNFKMIGDEAMQQRVRASLADPDLLVYKMRSAASEYSFMLVPASVPFLWLMFFWRRRVYLYDHVIFALHSLSFMALFIGALMAAYDLRPTLNLWGWLLVVPPLHMFFHLKGAYGLGVMGAVWRTCFLSMVALIVLISYAVAILVLGLVH
jgi:hypothetical protein